MIPKTTPPSPHVSACRHQGRADLRATDGPVTHAVGQGDRKEKTRATQTGPGKTQQDAKPLPPPSAAPLTPTTSASHTPPSPPTHEPSWGSRPPPPSRAASRSGRISSGTTGAAMGVSKPSGRAHLKAAPTPARRFTQGGLPTPVSRRHSWSAKWLQFLRPVAIGVERPHPLSNTNDHKKTTTLGSLPREHESNTQRNRWTKRHPSPIQGGSLQARPPPPEKRYA